MWANYIKDREGSLLYKNEKGFFTYKIFSDHLHIDDFFILQEYRNKGNGKELYSKIEQILKDNNLDLLKCTVCLDALNYKDSLEFVLKMGYKFDHFKYNLMIFHKRI